LIYDSKYRDRGEPEEEAKMTTLSFDDCVKFCVDEFNLALRNQHPYGISAKNPQGKSASTILCESVDKVSSQYGYNWYEIKRAAEAQL
jgi:hypothetical protein